MKKKIRKFAEGGLNVNDLKALNLRDQVALNPNALKALNVRHGYEMQNVPKTTTEVLPMNYVPSGSGRGGPSLAQRTETARVSGGYDTLVPQTEQYWANSRSRGGRGGGYATRQTGWLGTKQTPVSMINDLMLASNAFTPAPIPTVLPTASAPADGLGRFLGEQATGGNIATGRPTGGK